MTPKTMILILSIGCMISAALIIALLMYSGYLIDNIRRLENLNRYKDELIGRLNEVIDEMKGISL